MTLHYQDSISSPSAALHSHPKTQSLPRSGSGLTVDPQLSSSSTASGYVAAGRGNSLDNKTTPKARIQEPPTSSTMKFMPAQAHLQVLNREIGSHLSYPLQRLLAQPVSYDTENDNIDPWPPHDVPFHHHHGNIYHNHGNHPQVRKELRQHRRSGGENMPPDSSQSQTRGLNEASHGRVPNHIGFNPVRTSPNLHAVPPPIGSITIDIDV